MADLFLRLLKLRWIRFLLIGGLNTAFSYGLYATFIFIGLSYRLAYLLALLIGIFFSFSTQGAFVFHNREWGRLGRFALTWIMIYLFNMALIEQLMQTGFDAYIAGALTVVPSTTLSYFLQRFYVFRRAAKHG
jgi:putative flippase GtrA